MKTEIEIFSMVEAAVMNTLESIANDNLDPEYVADEMCEIYYMTSFAEDFGVKLPFRFSHRMIDKLFDCCLAVWPEMKNHIPVGLIPGKIMEDRDKAGSLLRMALTSIYHIEIEDDCPIPNSGIFDHQMGDAAADEITDDEMEFLRMFSIDD